MSTSIDIDSLMPGKPMKIDVDGKNVCVARIGDEVYAISDICSHAEASLAEGEINGFSIECWLHGAEFDMRTGEALTPPAIDPVEVYQVQREGSQVTISQKGA
jgi:3-phenylpropionate/trans-cinnamate dioxygenase ferredoxin component